MGDGFNDLLFRDEVLEFIVTMDSHETQRKTRNSKDRDSKFCCHWEEISRAAHVECLAALLPSRFSRRVATIGIGPMTVDGLS